MRRWAPRILWLSSWSFWLWLGFGLYRELPRDAGPIVARLPMPARTAVLGFVGDSNLVALMRVRFEDLRVWIVVADAESASVLRTVEAPDSTRYLTHETDSFSHGVIFANRHVGDTTKNERNGFHALHLQTGEWTRLSDRNASMLALHPTRPLVAFLDGDEDVVVSDLRTGERLVELDLTPSFLLGAAPIFLGHDQIALPLEAPASRPDADWSFNVYRIAMPPERLRTMRGPPIGRTVTSSAAGRVAYNDPRQPLGVRVFDVRRGAVVFADEQLPPGTALKPPVLASSGRSVLESPAGTLFDVETGATLWRAGSHETLVLPAYSHAFMVREDWSQLWSRLAPRLPYATLACRSIETGKLVARTPSDLLLADHRVNAAGTLLVLKNGEVHRLPLRVNWPFLALCQAILASPLVLLWGVLRWRRKRRIRMASVTP
jgi:hypothetical protein